MFSDRLQFGNLGLREIDFNEISNMVLLGKGGGGEVYKGEYEGKPIAVKRAYDEHELNIAHLVHLNHPHLVQFL